MTFEAAARTFLLGHGSRLANDSTEIDVVRLRRIARHLPDGTLRVAALRFVQLAGESIRAAAPGTGIDPLTYERLVEELDAFLEVAGLGGADDGTKS
jgi:hypothetical protein